VSSSAEVSKRLERSADQMNKAKAMLEQSGLVKPTQDDEDELPF